MCSANRLYCRNSWSLRGGSFGWAAGGCEDADAFSDAEGSDARSADDDDSEAIVRVWWRNRGFGRADEVGAIGWYVVLLLVG